MLVIFGVMPVLSSVLDLLDQIQGVLAVLHPPSELQLLESKVGMKIITSISLNKVRAMGCDLVHLYSSGSSSYPYQRCLGGSRASLTLERSWMVAGYCLRCCISANNLGGPSLATDPDGHLVAPMTPTSAGIYLTSKCRPFLGLAVEFPFFPIPSGAFPETGEGGHDGNPLCFGGDGGLDCLLHNLFGVLSAKYRGCFVFSLLVKAPSLTCNLTADH
jgi:hypothetical protein